MAAPLNSQQFFHGSPHLFEPGTVLEPGHGKNFKQSADAAVSITSDPSRARHWAKQAGDTAHVYEVEPLGDVGMWRASEHVVYEARTPRARVVRRLEDHEVYDQDARVTTDHLERQVNDTIAKWQVKGSVPTHITSWEKQQRERIAALRERHG
jgi:hypothetical protein